jgi:hypothetical protein
VGTVGGCVHTNGNRQKTDVVGCAIPLARCLGVTHKIQTIMPACPTNPGRVAVTQLAPDVACPRVQFLPVALT